MLGNRLLDAGGVFRADDVGRPRGENMPADYDLQMFEQEDASRLHWLLHRCRR